jgi:hypothetical protein
MAQSRLSAGSEAGIFVTNAARDALPGNPWHNRLRSVPWDEAFLQAPELEIYRLEDAWTAEGRMRSRPD